MKKYKFKGCNDDHDTCDCCGKTGLKKVVWLCEMDEYGEELSSPAPYGVVCAGKLLSIPGTRAKLQTTFKNMDYEEKKAKRNALMARIGAKREELAKKHGLVRNNGDWLFPEDVERIKGLFGVSRIRIAERPQNEIHPIFKILGMPEDLEQYL